MTEKRGRIPTNPALPLEKRRLLLVKGLMHVYLKPGAVDALRLWWALKGLQH
jgi:hypothetical protein